MRVEPPSELRRNPPNLSLPLPNEYGDAPTSLGVPLDKRKIRADSEALPTLAVVSLSKNASPVGRYFYLIRSRCPPEPAQASSGAAAVELRYTFSPLGKITSPVREPPR
jgi:hypothetical protein